MAGLVPAIHDLSRGTKNVHARDKPGHDEFVAGMPTKSIRICDSPTAQGRKMTSTSAAMAISAKPSNIANKTSFSCDIQPA
jgi:hypothetical protein